MKTPPFYTQEELTAAGVTFDTAIPQSIFDALTTVDPEVYGHFVTVYRAGSMMGYIQPTTHHGSIVWSRWDGKVGE